MLFHPAAKPTGWELVTFAKTGKSCHCSATKLSHRFSSGDVSKHVNVAKAYIPQPLEHG